MQENRINTEKDQKNQILDFLKSRVFFIIVFICVNFILKRFLIVNCSVSGISMQPTFEDKERVIAYRHSNLKRNDVVVLEAPDQSNSFYIKRIIGLPGDTIAAKNNQIFINGKKLKQDYLKPGFKLKDNASGFMGSSYSYTSDFSIRTLAKTPDYKQIYSENQLKRLKSTNRVPRNSYFVMGDHRSVSKDSRYIGFISRNKIEGVVKLRIWPFGRLQVF